MERFAGFEVNGEGSRTHIESVDGIVPDGVNHLIAQDAGGVRPHYPAGVIAGIVTTDDIFIAFAGKADGLLSLVETGKELAIGEFTGAGASIIESELIDFDDLR